MIIDFFVDALKKWKNNSFLVKIALQILDLFFLTKTSKCPCETDV